MKSTQGNVKGEYQRTKEHKAFQEVTLRERKGREQERNFYAGNVAIKVKYISNMVTDLHPSGPVLHWFYLNNQFLCIKNAKLNEYIKRQNI